MTNSWIFRAAPVEAFHDFGSEDEEICGTLGLIEFFAQEPHKSCFCLPELKSLEE